MTRLLAAGLLIAVSGCSQAFRFNDADAGDAGAVDAGRDAGPPDAGKDGGPTDAGPCALPGACECDGDAGCAGVRARCADDHRCVECLDNADCGANGLCDAKTRRCTTPCTTSTQCSVDTRNHCEGDPPAHCVACEDFPNTCPAATPWCAESVGYCVVCAADAHCAAPTPRCDKRFGTCVACLTSADCPADRYCAVTTGTCTLR